MMLETATDIMDKRCETCGGDFTVRLISGHPFVVCSMCMGHFSQSIRLGMYMEFLGLIEWREIAFEAHREYRDGLEQAVEEATP